MRGWPGGGGGGGGGGGARGAQLSSAPAHQNSVGPWRHHTAGSAAGASALGSAPRAQACSSSTSAALEMSVDTSDQNMSCKNCALRGLAGLNLSAAVRDAHGDSDE